MDLPYDVYILVVDRLLLRRKRGDLAAARHALERYGAGAIHAARLHALREQLHHGEPAVVDRPCEVALPAESRAIAPEPHALEELEVLRVVRGRGGKVEYARVRQRLLNIEDGLRPRRLLVAIYNFVALRGGVRLVERDHAVEVLAQPLDELRVAALSLAAGTHVFFGVRPAIFLRKRRIGGERNPLVSRREPRTPPLVELEQPVGDMERLEVVKGAVEKLVVLGDDERPAVAELAVHRVEHHARDHARLAYARAVAAEVPHAASVGKNLVVRIDRLADGLVLVRL